MKKFQDILIFTDLDGTLLKNDKSVSRENINAIEYFKKNGGKFTFVTGRMPYYVGNILEYIKPNVPYGCINGGGLYDYEKQKYLWTSNMAEEVPVLIKYIDEMFTDVGIQVCTYDKTYFCRENETMKNFRKNTGIENLVCNYNEVKEPIAKVMFGSEDNEVILKIKDALYKHPLSEKFDFIRSERTLFEILPKGVNKGTAITKLCEHLNLDPDKTIALGDYNNDVSMLKAAKVGIAVSNACDEAIEVADYITVSNEENALEAVIYNLEKGKYI